MFESRAGSQQKSDEGFEETGSEGASGGKARAEKMGAAVWAEIRVPVVRPDGWPVHHLRMGLRELERLHREIDAARALLTGAMPESRDTVADIARNAGISNREARRRKSVADVCGKVKGALEKLQSGTISNEHVSALAPVADMPGAARLLDDAASKSPEDLTREVEEFRLSAACGNDMAKRQRARRSIRFFAGPEGMIGINGFLPPVEGTELKNRLAAIVDAKWRSEHPDRAKVLGGHGDDTHDQRMADALLAMAGVQSQSSEETLSPEAGQSSDPAQNSERAHPFETHSATGKTVVDDTTTNDQSAAQRVNPDTPCSGSMPESREKAASGAGQVSVRATRTEGEPTDTGKISSGIRGSGTRSGESADLLRNSSGGRALGIQEDSSSDQASTPNVDRESQHETQAGEKDLLGPVSLGHVGQQDQPPAAMSFNVGLRLVGLDGLGGSADRERLRSASVANSPPAGSATTVKTGKPAVVIVFDVDRWKARIAGGGPIPITESLLDQARNDLYYCFKNMAGEVIKFGRSRRDPTPIQRLVLVVRDEKCLYPGCHAPPDICDAHHLNEVVKDEGPTDTDLMGLFCEAHHRHIHLNDLVVKRNLNGSLTITERRTGVVIASSKSRRAA